MQSQVLSLNIPKVLLQDARQIAESSGLKQSQVLRMAMTNGMIGLRDLTRVGLNTPDRKEDQK